MISTFVLYNFILFGSTFFIYCSEKCKYRFDRNVLLLIAFLIVALPAALRYNIGIDYRGYVAIYNNIANGGTGNVEPIFYWLNYFLTSNNLDVQWVFGITSFIIYFLIIKSYPSKNAYIIHFFFLAYFYLSSYTFIRTYIVFGFTLIAIFNYISNKNKLQFIIILLFASMFHKSAIFIAPIVFFDNFKLLHFLRKNILIFFITIIGTYLFRYQLVHTLFDLPIIDWLGYRKYINNSHFLRESEISTGLGAVFRLFILLTPFFFLKRVLKDEPHLSIILILNIFTLIAFILSMTYFIFMRVHYAFYPAYILSPYLLLNLSSHYKNKSLLIFLILLMSLGILAIFQKEIATNQSNLCRGHRSAPYISIFNKADDKSMDMPGHVCLPLELNAKGSL